MKKFKLFLVLFLALFINVNIIKADYFVDNSTPITKERTEENNYGVNKHFKITSKNKSYILRTPYVDETEKVYDFANILSKSDEQIIYTYSKEFMDKTGMEMIFVTIDMPYFDDTSNEDYAADFYDYNDFGIDLEHYDGILLLRNNYSNDRYYDMYTFGKAQLYFDQKRYDDVLDSIYYELSTDKYIDGFKEFKDLCLKYYNYGIANKYKKAYIDENGFIRYNYSVPYILSLGIASVVTLITMLILINKNKMIKKATKASEYVDKKSINYSVKNDNFIRSRTTSYRVSSGGGGGSSGGSSGGGHSSGGGRHG